MKKFVRESLYEAAPPPPPPPPKAAATVPPPPPPQNKQAPTSPVILKAVRQAGNAVTESNQAMAFFTYDEQFKKDATVVDLVKKIREAHVGLAKYFKTKYPSAFVQAAVAKSANSSNAPLPPPPPKK